MITCCQIVADSSNCTEPAIVRYAWPGRDESFACIGHAERLRSIALAMGLPIQLIVLTGADHIAANAIPERAS